MATARTKILAIEIQRYSGHGEPSYKRYEIDFDEELTVLDALNIVKDRYDGSLTFRWSCRMGICGSCGVQVNGKPMLACQTYIKEYGSQIQISPLKNFAVIKDLVSDISDVFEKMGTVNPWISSAKRLTDGENLQTPKQRKRLEQTSQCIKCMLCYSACPVYGLDKKFLGPAASALAYRYIADNRNEQKEMKLNSVVGEKGVWSCSFVGECSVVCPKRVDPALALQRLKLMGSLRLLLS